MNKNTIKQVLVLAVTAIVLYFSGLHLITLGNLKSLSDGLIVMSFFFAFFPFLSTSTTLSIKILKLLFGFRSI